jgi:hypothetical protein
VREVISTTREIRKMPNTNNQDDNVVEAEEVTETAAAMSRELDTRNNEVNPVPGLAGHEDDENQVRDLVGGINATDTEIEEIQKQLEAKQHSKLEKALLAGEILCRLKEAHKKAHGHGSWQDYVKSRIGCSPKKASMYMRFHARCGELEKSEIFPKLGIAEADKLLKKPKEAEPTEDISEGEIEMHRSPDLDATAYGACYQDTLELADGKSLSLTDVDWEEGLISTSDLVELIQQTTPGNDQPSGKTTAAHEQMMIATIAASVNRACGPDGHQEAPDQICSALEKVREFLHLRTDGLLIE